MGILQNLTGWHALIVLAVIVLLFGATKLPSLARSVGESMRIFRDESRSDATVSPPVDGIVESATAGTSPAADPVAVPAARSA